MKNDNDGKNASSELEKMLQTRMEKMKEKDLVNVMHLNGTGLIAYVSWSVVTLRAQNFEDYNLGLILVGKMGFTRIENPSQKDGQHIVTIRRNWIRALPFLIIQLTGSVRRSLYEKKRKDLVVANNCQKIQGQLVS
ncbi:MAG: hypothetical protein PF549_03085 [Patescibacteria group bacterium]|jgi:hypothetical protein|nr:hypothetical protein [Patescibacteria group bacterium]